MSNELFLAVAGNAAGAGEATYVEDVFSTYLYEGNGTYSPKTGTNTIENGIALSDANSGGSVEFDGTGDYLAIPDSTDFDFGTGDFTWEAWIQTNVNVNYQNIVGQWDGGNAWGIHTNSSGTITYFTATSTVYNGSITVTDNAWHHIAITRQSGTIRLFVDGVPDGSSSDTNTIGDTGNVRIGSLRTGYERYFAGYISNVRLVKGTAIYTSAFTPSTTALTAVSGTSLLTCQGDTPLVDNSSNAHTITVNGDATAKAFGPFTSDTPGEGGLVWVKGRSAATSHFLYDTERGTSNFLSSNATNAENTTYSGYGVTSYNSNGFTLEGNVLGENANGADLCSWTFAKQEKFFDVVTYTGNGTPGRTVAHNLGSVPGCIIVKRLNATVDWAIYHRGVDATNPQNYWMKFNTDAREDNLGLWNDTAPTSTEFTVGSSSAVNNASGTYVAYLFAHNDGDGIFGENGDQDIIKCGSFTTDGSANASIDLGFEPQWVLLKRTNSAGNWYLLDNMRGIVTGGNEVNLTANTSDADNSNFDLIDITATGFNSTYTGFTNDTFIYIAIRRGPMKTPTSGTEVFAMDQLGQTSPTPPSYNAPWPVDMGIQKATTGSDTIIATRLLDGGFLKANATTAYTASSPWVMDFQNGFRDSTASSTAYYGWMFRRAPGFFDVVCYEGDNSNDNKAHNLGVAPEMMIIKCRGGATNWRVYHKDLGELSGGLLNSNAFSTSYDAWNDKAPTATEFFVTPAHSNVNSATLSYIAYLFATVPGVSKVGSVDVTANVPKDVDCGFTTGARFVLVKRTDASGDWFVWDTERGIVSGNDPYLLLNTTGAEVTNTDLIDPLSSGFTLNFNATGTWIFLAIA